MRFRNTLIALIVLLVIGGYAFVIRFYSKPVETARMALKVKPDEISKIELKYQDRELILERKAGAPWVISKPIATGADQVAANHLAQAIAYCRITKTVEERPDDLARFGLAKPHVVVDVTTKDNRRLPAIEVGRTTPVGFSTYVKLAAEPAVMLTSSAFHSVVNTTLDQMRDHTLMAVNFGTLKRLTIEHADGSTVEVDHENGRWMLAKPARYPVDSEVLGRFMKTLVDSKVTDFVNETPGDLAPYGLVKPRLTVTLYSGDGDSGRQSLVFGSEEKEHGKNGIYIRRGDHSPVAAVPRSVFQSLNKSVLDLRDKTVLGLEPLKVETVEAHLKGKEFRLKRAGGVKWNLVENGKTSEADTVAVQTFLKGIRHFKGRAIVTDSLKDPAAYGMDKPALLFKFADKDGKSLGELKLSRVEAKNTASTLGQEGTAYYVSSTASTTLFAILELEFNDLANVEENLLPKSTPTPSASASPSAH